jgi:DNA-binding GntR family transcriptional regulator
MAEASSNEERSSGDSAAEPPELRSQLVARRIREAILSGRLRPGDRIPQDTLAREFGTSRIPVREALAELEGEGLIALAPHAGARVAKFNVAELEEVYRIRESVEPMVIAESAEHLTDEQVAELRLMVGEIEASTGRPEDWLQLDRRFHVATYAGADLPRARALVEGFWNRTQHYRRALILALDLKAFEIVHLEHRAILDALERRSGEDAAAALRSHIRRTRKTLLKRAHGFEAPRAT